jgi:hypothetical protein
MFSNCRQGVRRATAVIETSITNLVSVPVFHHLVLPYGPEVVTSLLLLEGYLHHTLLMGKQAFVAISKVKSPYFDVLVRGTGDNEL